MQKLILFIMGVACALSSCHAQPSSNKNTEIPPSQISPLKIGDTVPDIVFRHMLNYKDSTARLSDFKGKAVLLDFFATWCGSCIAALPKLQTLQDSHERRLQILVVGYEPRVTLQHFLETNPIGKSLGLSFIVDDTILGKLFPHKIIPHEVWVNTQGIVVAITGADEINANNIHHFLAGERLVLPLKKDVLDFDRNDPLLVDNNGGSDQDMLYHSLLTKHLTGLFSGTGYTLSHDSLRRREYYLNEPLLMLYEAAIGRPFDNRILLEVPDSGRFIRSGMPWDRWAPDHSYCYEITVPTETPRQRIRSLMLDDLNRYFGLWGRMEERNVPCYALQALPQGIHARNIARQAPYDNLFDQDSAIKIMRNKPLARLVDVLNYQIPATPLHPIVVDESGYNKPLNLHFDIINIFNISDLNNALESYGLTINPVVRKLKVFVLTDTSHYRIIGYRNNAIPNSKTKHIIPTPKHIAKSVYNKK